MNLYAAIPQRKSCRKYDMQPLGADKLGEIEQAIGSFQPLSPDISLKWRFVNQVKGIYHIQAPHYLVISGQGKNGEKESAGFLFQQLALWFDTMELGCVWLGESKDVGAERSKNDIITMAFGSVTEPVHRTMEQFKRKPIETITNAVEDICIQAAHLAPSGMNTQPWYFEKLDDRVLVYRQKLKLPLSVVYKHSDIDMGIALCHYYLACKESEKPFHFSREKALPEKAGFLPFGIIS
ncbi:hypothetical protein LJB89_03260 [Tyzzerella sp. OttesenSCG-928-J15]|nr:hypothetical protein [Tyzzerella sp. OttesenSCG-928-J15]